MSKQKLTEPTIGGASIADQRDFPQANGDREQLPPEQRVEAVAHLLELALTAQKHRGITKAKVAQDHGVRGSNISAFVKSAGAVRNVSLLVVERILHTLGVHADGFLTHGLHRWDLVSRRVSLKALCGVLELNSNPDVGACGVPTWIRLPKGKTKQQLAFIAFRPCEGTLFIGRLREECRPELEQALGVTLASVELDVPGAAELLTCWQMTMHDWVVVRAITRLLGWPSQVTHDDHHTHGTDEK